MSKGYSPAFMTMVNCLKDMPETALIVMYYKMSGHKHPVYVGKGNLVLMVVRLLEDAFEKLQGQTLPADIHVINNLKQKFL